MVVVPDAAAGGETPGASIVAVDDAGGPLGAVTRHRDLAEAVRDIEAADRPRWVWSNTAAVYPALLRAGVRVQRCHDLATTRAILGMRVKSEDYVGGRAIKISVRSECFSGGIEDLDWTLRKPYDEFDYGYVLTVHKAQGSQWDDVVLFDESFAFQDSRQRWLYTGITRAAKRLTVVM